MSYQYLCNVNDRVSKFPKGIIWGGRKRRRFLVLSPERVRREAVRVKSNLQWTPRDDGRPRKAGGSAGSRPERDHVSCKWQGLRIRTF